MCNVRILFIEWDVVLLRMIRDCILLCVVVSTIYVSSAEEYSPLFKDTTPCREICAVEEIASGQSSTQT